MRKSVFTGFNYFHQLFVGAFQKEFIGIRIRIANHIHGYITQTARPDYYFNVSRAVRLVTAMAIFPCFYVVFYNVYTIVPVKQHFGLARSIGF